MLIKRILKFSVLLLICFFIFECFLIIFFNADIATRRAFFCEDTADMVIKCVQEYKEKNHKWPVTGNELKDMPSCKYFPFTCDAAKVKNKEAYLVYLSESNWLESEYGTIIVYDENLHDESLYPYLILGTLENGAKIISGREAVNFCNNNKKLGITYSYRTWLYLSKCYVYFFIWISGAVFCKLKHNKEIIDNKLKTEVEA